MASMQGAVEGREDGRLARSARTKRAIVDALRSLHQEGDLRPTAPRVAERAGVSLRTVFQHFSDLETLLVEAGQRDFEIAMHYVEPIDVATPLAHRTAELVRQRARMFEALAPVWRAARLQEPFSPQIRRNRDRLLELARHQLERVFAGELAAVPRASYAATLNALQVMTTWATWEFLRGELHLGPDAAHDAMCTMLTGLLSTD